jgi:hypothetical protein
MRSFCLLAVLSAVLSAEAAAACCFFKSTPRPVSPAAAAPGAVSAAERSPTSGTTYLEIESVGGKTPDTSTDPWRILDPLPPGSTEVVVDVDYGTGMNYPVYVYLQEQSSMAPAAKKVAAIDPQHYFWHDWNTKFIVPTPAAPPSGATKVEAGTSRIYVYELDYTISTDANKSYLVWAQAEDYNHTVIKTSHKVAFSTSAAVPPGPMPAGARKK